MWLFAICAGTGREQWGQLAPTLGPCGRCPKPSVRTEKLQPFIFSFRFYRWKGQRVKNKWLKTDEKTRIGVTLGFFLSITTLANVSWAPQPEDSSRATAQALQSLSKLNFWPSFLDLNYRLADIVSCSLNTNFYRKCCLMNPMRNFVIILDPAWSSSEAAASPRLSGTLAFEKILHLYN